MKKIYITLAIVGMLSTSCEDFLNTKPIDKIGAINYFTDEKGLTEGLAGVYDPLGAAGLYGEVLYTKLEACTDEGYYARSGQKTDPMVYVFNPTDPSVSTMWNTLYTGANRANDLIANINLPTMDEKKRQTILGEALFLRGYYYFMLVSRFGDIPMKTTPTTSPNGVDLPRTPTAQVYAQIIKDMTEAESKVSTSTELGYSSRVSKTVVQGILARVCLQMAGYPLMDTEKYKDALSWSKKVIDSGEHTLNQTFNTDPIYNTFNPSYGSTANNAYRQIFINQVQDKYDVKESMWEIDFKGNRSDGYIETGRLGNTNGITFTGAALFTKIGYSYGFIRGTGRLFNKYGVGDLRRDWVLTTYTLNNTTGARVAIVRKTGAAASEFPYGRDCGKWRREYEGPLSKEKNHNSNNFPVLRYADVLLMMAESENQVNGPTISAYNAVNQVRRRGYGLPINTPSIVADLPVGLSKVTFQLAIEDERMRELCFEGTRKSDLIRWNKFVQTMNAVGAEMSSAPTTANQQYGGFGGTNVEAKHLLYPIPSREIATNKALGGINNPGW